MSTGLFFPSKVMSNFENLFGKTIILHYKNCTLATKLSAWFQVLERIQPIPVELGAILSLSTGDSPEVVFIGSSMVGEWDGFEQEKAGKSEERKNGEEEEVVFLGCSRVKEVWVKQEMVEEVVQHGEEEHQEGQEGAEVEVMVEEEGEVMVEAEEEAMAEEEGEMMEEEPGKEENVKPQVTLNNILSTISLEARLLLIEGVHHNLQRQVVEAEELVGTLRKENSQLKGKLKICKGDKNDWRGI